MIEHQFTKDNLAQGLFADYMCGCAKGPLLGPCEHAAEADFMPCLRACGVDIRHHHSTDRITGGCDTGPMSASDMRDWFELRGAGQPGFLTVAELLEEHYGKTQDELDEMYEAMSGLTA